MSDIHRRKPHTASRDRKPSYDHTEGSILGSVLRMGLPSMIGFAAGNLYSLADIYWVSRLGEAPLAAVGIFGSIYWVISSANMIAGTGSVAVISRRYGEKDYEKTSVTIVETFILKWILAVLCGVPGLLFLSWTLRFFTPQEAAGLTLEARGTIRLAIEYGRLMILGLGFSFCSYSVYTALRGVGQPVMSMVIMLFGTVLNMVLDPFVIFGWGPFPALGVKGAALASVFSYGVTFFIGLVIFYGGFANVRVRLAHTWKISLRSMWKMMAIGFPSGINSISFSLSRLALTKIVTLFGTGITAAYTMGNHVSALGIMIVVGMGLGLSALIGQNLGAGKKERARYTAQKAMIICVGLMSFVGLLQIAFAPQIASAFLDDPDLVAAGVSLLRIIALALPFIGATICMEMIYSGAGDNKPAMIFGVITGWAFEVTGAYVLTRFLGTGELGIWWAITGASVIGAGMFYALFRRGYWLEKKV